MGIETAINWTDATWNPWQGCTRVSAGCANCYMFTAKKRYGQDGGIVTRSAAKTFNMPLARRRGGEYRIPRGSKVFVCSWSDFFHPDADAWRDEAWQIIRQRPDLIFQILTKRPERICNNLPCDWGDSWPNVWLGVTVESDLQRWRLPWLLNIPAAVHFVSVEPMLRPVSLIWNYNGQQFDALRGRFGKGTTIGFLDWVICGAESGPRARKMELRWAGRLQDECHRSGTAFFMKQICENGRPIEFEQFPPELQIREFPPCLWQDD